MLTDSTPGTVGDYAASIGTTGYDYSITLTTNNVTFVQPPTGAFVQATGIRTADFKDGLSNTLLVGEKYLPRGVTVTYPYDCNLYDGHNIICSTRCAGPGYPLGQALDDPRLLFGGPHVGICQFVFADGSVHPVRTSIDEVALGLLSHREDGQPAPSDY